MAGASTISYLKAERSRDEFIQELLRGASPKEACETLGIKPTTYRQWRQRDPFFAAEIDSIRSGARKFKEEAPSWDSFAEFRKLFFGHETPPHQALMINAWEQTKPGDVTLTLIFPSSGKTTLAEDYFCYRLATDPDYRIMVGCEAQQLAQKILTRVKQRMEESGPFPKFVEQFGPFIPQNMDGRASRQVWSANAFNVYKRQAYDERDFSMAGIGFGSNIVGTRTDHLHCDDLQSTKTISQTEKMFDTFRQDWLSRPGESGITTINGTRVADGDLYEKLEDEYGGEDFFHIVRLPAIVRNHVTGEDEPLWPYDPNAKHAVKGWTMEMLDRQRKKVGEDAWARNWMQKPRAAGLGTFTVDIIDRCLNPERGIDDPLPESGPIYIGLDPALGGINCLTAWQITSKKLYLVAIQEDSGFGRNEQIMDALERMVLRMQALGGNVTDVVIETMNFQRGLARDERLQEMSVRHGFSIREHLSGANKYDPNIGVPSMSSTFIKKEIDLPWKADERTREQVGQFREQLLRWKPGIKGNVLRQDMVMSCLDVDTPLWTTDGWKTMGSVEVGDRVATAEGTTATVLSKSPRRRAPVWLVSLGDGSSLRADDGHRWWIEPQANSGRRLAPRWMTTLEMAEAIKDGTFRRLSIRRPDPIDVPDVDLPVDPYLLGVWLGDGDARQGTIVQHISDIPELRSIIEAAGYETTPHKGDKSFGVLNIRGHLASLGLLANKHVPDIYLKGSSDQRLALLQGLMDTDGTVIPGAPRPGRCTFGNSNKSLVDAVNFLALSLGFRTRVYHSPATISKTPSSDASEIQEFWRVVFNADASTPCPFRLSRKAARCGRKLSRRTSWITVTEVVPDGEAEVQCILIDHPSHVFLAGERLVPTGNCWFVWILWMSRRRHHLAAGTSFKSQGLPWSPTQSGLLLPAGASPFYGR